MVSSELQNFADNLAARLARSVAVDDAQLRLLVHSSHDGAVDEARVASVMKRALSDDGVAYIHRHRAVDMHDIFEIPPNPGAGFGIGRIGIPIRHRGVLQGFIWLMASEGQLPPEHADALRNEAETASLILHRQVLLGELDRRHERELTRDLLSEDRQVASEAADQLVSEDLLVGGSSSVLVLATTESGVGAPLARDRLALVLEQTRRQLPPRRALHLERPDHGILVVVQPPRRKAVDLAGTAKVLRAAAAEEFAGNGPRPFWVAIGQEHDSLAGANLSYEEARRAANIARVIEPEGSVMEYGRLGVYGLLAMMPAAELRAGLHPAVEQLRRHGDGDVTLLDTLETFLDNAGSAKRTAAVLRIQPASLYYRLRRIAEITDVDLGNGNERLLLHLSLKISRLLPSP